MEEDAQLSSNQSHNLAKEMAHDLEVNFNKFAPFSEKDRKASGSLADAVENAEVAEIDGRLPRFEPVACGDDLWLLHRRLAAGWVLLLQRPSAPISPRSTTCSLLVMTSNLGRPR